MTSAVRRLGAALAVTAAALAALALTTIHNDASSVRADSVWRAPATATVTPGDSVWVAPADEQPDDSVWKTTS